jgi:hypothetical protein
MKFRFSHTPGLAALSLALALAGTASTNGAIVVQELFDAIAGPPPGADASLAGKGDTATSIGMTGVWTINGANTGIYTASNFNVNMGLPDLPGLPSNNGETGGVWNNTGSYDTGIYATRPLAVPIDFKVAQTLYFSFLINNSGDTSMGLGFASGEDTLEFVGVGVTWDNAKTISTGVNDAGNAAYISHGILGDGDGGPYGVQAHEAAGSVNGPALLVGRLVISATGVDTIDVKRYEAGDTIEGDPSQVTWSVSDSVDSSMVATDLLLWINGISGNNAGEIDGIRIGTTWADVTGVTGGNSSGPGDDPDHDGISNAIEAIIGGNPNAGDDHDKLPVIAQAGSNVEFTYRRAAASNVAPFPFVEYSTDLTTWTPAANGVSGVVITATTDFYATGIDRVVVALPKTLAPGQRIFVRLNANR